MDSYAHYNQERWDALAAANVEYSRPAFDLNPTSARQSVDPYSLMGDVNGKKVLCLACGGGQQSVAFGLLGAEVTVFDLSAVQLERDKMALAHHQLTAAVEQGDMRDLSRFADDTFDIVWHAYSINFVPDVNPMFDEIRRVLRPSGLYRLEWHNPFSKGTDETDWTGEGYLLSRVYRDGEVTLKNPHWDIYQEDGTLQQVEGPQEFNHGLSTVLNGLLQRSFSILGLWEDLSGNAEAAAGSWEHFKAVAPPMLTVWSQLREGD